jgi:hypothetical protein
MVADFNYLVDSKKYFGDSKNRANGMSMDTQEKQKLLSVGANNVATLLHTLNKLGVKSSGIKTVLSKIDKKEFADSNLTKLKNPVKYPSVFSEDTLKGYYDALMSTFQNKLENIESPFDLLRGWYRVNTLAFNSKIISHIVKIDYDQNGELRMFWDYDLVTKEFGAHGVVNVRGPQLFVELTPNNKDMNMEGVANSRNRYLILHTGLFDRKSTHKEAFSGMITRLRSNSSEIISYMCLFVKLDAILSEKNPKVIINAKTPLDKVIHELNSSRISDSLDDYANTFFDPRHFRDKEKKHCLTVTPLDNYLLTDIPKSDIFLKERSENEKLAGLYMMVCNLPSENSAGQIMQRRNIGYVFINPDSTVRIKTDNYYYRGNCVIYPGTNILEIRAEAYLSDIRFDDVLVKTDREFSVLLTFSLGDHKFLDFKWLSGVSVAVSQDNAPIALSEKLIRMDKYFMKNMVFETDESVFEYQLNFFENIQKDYFKSGNGLMMANNVLAHYEIDNVDLMLSYIKSAREFDTAVEKSLYSYQVYLDSFYGGIYNLENAYKKRKRNFNVSYTFDTTWIDYEAQILFNTLSNFQELYRHGFRYDFLDVNEKEFFDDILSKILDENSVLNKYLGDYLFKSNIENIKLSKPENVPKIFDHFPTNKNSCKINILEMALNQTSLINENAKSMEQESVAA